MFDLKDVKIYKRWGSGNDFVKQEVMSLMIFRVNKMAPAGAAIWLQGIKTFFMESSTVIARAQQPRNATAAQFVSLVLCSQTGRIRKNFKCSHYENRRIIQEITLFGLYLNRLLGILNEQRCHFEGIAEESERDMDWFEETATQPIVTLTRNGKVRRPWFIVAREHLET